MEEKLIELLDNGYTYSEHFHIHRFKKGWELNLYYRHRIYMNETLIYKLTPELKSINNQKFIFKGKL